MGKVASHEKADNPPGLDRLTEAFRARGITLETTPTNNDPFYHFNAIARKNGQTVPMEIMAATLLNDGGYRSGSGVLAHIVGESTLTIITEEVDLEAPFDNTAGFADAIAARFEMQPA